MSVVALIPAYNEEERVGETVSALLEGGVCQRAVVIDDGSKDRTAQRAAKAGAWVHRLGRNQGKGAAVAQGLGTFSLSDDEVIILADADLGESAHRLKILSDAVLEGKVDQAVAQLSTPGGFGLAKGIARQGIRWLTGRDVTSPLCGQRAMKAGTLRSLLPLPPGWGIEVALTVKALWLGHTVEEIPLELTHRNTGKDAAGFWHRGQQCMAVVETLYSLARTPRPKTIPSER